MTPNLSTTAQAGPSHPASAARTSKIGQRVVIATWVLAIVAGWFITSGGFAADFIEGMDFRAFYTAGRMVLGGAGGSLYDLSTQFAWQSRIFPHLQQIQFLAPFRSTPFVALPLLPVSILPLRQAYVAWGFLNLAALAVCCRLLMQCVSISDQKSRFRILLLLLMFCPAFATLTNGQFSFVMLMALAGAYLALRSGRDEVAGLWVSLLLAKPQLLLVPGLALVWQRRWRALAGLILGCGIWLVVSLLLVGWPGLLAYGTSLVGSVSWGNVYASHPQLMYSWFGLMHRLLGTDAMGPVLAPWLIGEILAVAALLLALNDRHPADTGAFSLQWALVVVVTLFTSPHVNYHDLILLSLAGVLVLDQVAGSEMADRSYGRWAKRLLILGYLVVSVNGVLPGTWQFQFSVLVMLGAIPLLAALLIRPHRGQGRGVMEIEEPAPQG